MSLYFAVHFDKRRFDDYCPCASRGPVYSPQYISFKPSTRVMSTPPLPLPGLRNCLASHLTSSDISALSETHQLIIPSKELSLKHVASPSTQAIIHAAGPENVFATVTNTNYLILRTPVCTTVIPKPLKFLALSLALRTTGSTTTIFVAGFDGVHVAEVHGSVPPPATHALTGTNGYPIVCMAILENMLAAASIDGRIIIMESLNTVASHILRVKPEIHQTDRITDMAFCEDVLLVAWWSGHLVCYNCSDMVVKWKLRRIERPATIFKMGPGCFLATSAAFAALCQADGTITFVRVRDGATVVRRPKGDKVIMKGFCAGDGALFAWIWGRWSLDKIQWISPSDFERAMKLRT